MKQRLFFWLLVTGLIVLALGGWTVQGLRWAKFGGLGARAAAACMTPESGHFEALLGWLSE